jgi:adenylate cyclase
LEQVLAHYDPLQHGPLVFRYGQDFKVTALSFGVMVLWLLGYPDQACRKSEEALAFSQELVVPFNVAYAFANAALMHQFCGEIPRTQERAEATITFATEHGFPHWVNWGTAFRGWALAAQGQGEVGISLLRQSLATLTASRVRLARPHLLTLLVDACRRMGQTEDGLNAVAEALAQVQDTGERYCEAELYRLRGELTLAQSRASLKQISNKSKASQNKSRVSNPQSATHNPQLAEAEACFLKAIEIARTQQAKSLELRAVMSLVRLRQYEAAQAASRITQHETRAMLNKAHAMLSDIYNWFTEGFETKDLQEAKVLLDALRA